MKLCSIDLNSKYSLRLVMLAGPRFALSEFSAFTYTKLENSNMENSDFSKTKLKKYTNWRKKLTFRSLMTIIV